MHRDAAGALGSLAESSANQQTIAEAGGIAPLVALLVVAQPAKEAAAGAIGALATLGANRTAIAQANGVAALVSLFDGGSVAAAEGAAATDAPGDGRFPISRRSAEARHAAVLVELDGGVRGATRLLLDMASDPRSARRSRRPAPSRCS